MLCLRLSTRSIVYQYTLFQVLVLKMILLCINSTNVFLIGIYPQLLQSVNSFNGTKQFAKCYIQSDMNMIRT